MSCRKTLIEIVRRRKSALLTYLHQRHIAEDQELFGELQPDGIHEILEIEAQVFLDKVRQII